MRAVGTRMRTVVHDNIATEINSLSASQVQPLLLGTVATLAAEILVLEIQRHRLQEIVDARQRPDALNRVRNTRP